MASSGKKSDRSCEKSKELCTIADETTHVVVEFNDHGSKSIELALRSWLFVEKRKWYCYWPTGGNMQFAEEYVRKGTEPHDSWAKYKVAIMSQATNYDQGIRRLKRLCDGADLVAAASFVASSQIPLDTAGTSKDTAKLNQLLHRNNNATIFDVNESADGWSDSASTASLDGVNRRVLSKKAKQLSAESIRDMDAIDKTSIPVDTLISGAERRLRKKMSRLEQNLLFEIKNQFKHLLQTVVPSASLQSIGETISKCKETLGVEEIKCCTIEDFDAMETKLEDGECRKAMKSWMLLMQNGGRDLKDSISKILTSYISKAVQLQFSGSGRKVRGEGKRDYSATHAFACMKDILLDLHPCDPAIIRSTVGKWLAGAGDREGGKKARSSSA